MKERKRERGGNERRTYENVVGRRWEENEGERGGGGGGRGARTQDPGVRAPPRRVGPTPTITGINVPTLIAHTRHLHTYSRLLRRGRQPVGVIRGALATRAPGPTDHSHSRVDLCARSPVDVTVSPVEPLILPMD